MFMVCASVIMSRTRVPMSEPSRRPSHMKRFFMPALRMVGLLRKYSEAG